MRGFLTTGIFLSTSLAHASVNRTTWGKTPQGTPVDLCALRDGDLTGKITCFGARK